jgi:pimeloyl-ACP methyl ester carboxylesterase
MPSTRADRFRETVLDVDNVTLHVREAGPPDGDPLLLVHGWPQHSGCWRRVAGLLDDRYRCVMPDRRGHGRSSAPSEGYEKQRLAQDMLGLLDALQLERVGYVGHDWGGLIGFLLALRSPERLNGLLALSIPHPWPSWHDRLNPWRLTAFAYQLPLSAPVVGERLMRAGLTRLVLRSASQGTFTPEDIASYDDAMSTPDGARVTVALYRTFLLRELGPLAAGRITDRPLTVPTQLLVGEHDPIARGADLAGFESHADEMIVERVPGAGHFLPEERPELVAERARELFGASDSVVPRKPKVPLPAGRTDLFPEPRPG